MPWYDGDFPRTYKYEPVDLRERALAIANKLLMDGVDEDIAVATGLKRARQYFAEIVLDEIPVGSQNA